MIVHALLYKDKTEFWAKLGMYRGSAVGWGWGVGGVDGLPDPDSL